MTPAVKPAVQPAPGHSGQQSGWMDDLSAWYNKIPPCTRILLTGIVMGTLLVRNGLVPGRWIMLDAYAVTRQLQLWRLFTNYFVFGMGFPLLMNLFFVLTYSGKLETSYFYRRRVDYVWFLVFTMLLSDTFGMMVGFPVLGNAMIASIIYLWAQLNRDTMVSFYFGIQVKAIYLPMVIVGFEYVTQGQLPIDYLMGIVSAHAYWFLEEIYPKMPQNNGQKLIGTPSIL